MKIAKLLGEGQVRIEDAAKPVAAPGFVIVKTVTSVICGSEMHTYRHGGQETGNTGHEAAGTVAEVGAGVTALKLGDRVAASAVAGCGDCDYCREGKYTYCPNHRVFCDMHAEYFQVPALACNKLPDDMPWAVGALLGGDGFGVPYHTSTKIPAEGIDTVAVFGLDPIGLGNVIFQSWLGRKVIGIDRSPERLNLTARFGASNTILAAADTDVPAAVRDQTCGIGADVCIEAAGSPVTAKQCFDAVRTAGLVIFNGEQPSVDLSPSTDFIRRDITAVGSWFFHFSEFAPMTQLWRKGLPAETLITHKLPFERIADGYRSMGDAESGKVQLVYD